MSDPMFEEDIFGPVLANEKTCKMFLEKLQERGVQFSTPIEEMTHETMIESGLAILKELSLREMAKQVLH